MEKTTDHDLLVRIDERTTALHNSVSDLRCTMGSYVTRKEFTPIKSVVYGMVGLILTGVISQLIILIVK